MLPGVVRSPALNSRYATAVVTALDVDRLQQLDWPPHLRPAEDSMRGEGFALAKLAFDSDFGAAMEEPSAARFGRQYLAFWETRNLRMASNIREMLGPRPGIRALVVVGASHKGYLEAYLNQMHDIRIADAAAILR